MATMFRALLALLTSLALAMLSLRAPFAADARDVERDPVREAAMIHNIARFTQWPAGHFRSDSAPVLFCVGATSGLKNALSAFPEKFVGARPIRLVLLGQHDVPAACDVLFVDETLASRTRQQALRGIYGVVTVSDLPDFVGAGGHVGVFSADGRLRFRIDVPAARRSGISFSSKLLGLGEVIGK